MPASTHAPPTPAAGGHRFVGLVVVVGLIGPLTGCADPDGASAPARLPPPADAPLVGEVDPFVGSANDGQTLPGAAVPWGMVSPSPHTTLTDPLTFLSEARCSSGYLAGAERLYGFGQTHLSGVGCPDLGAPVIMPTVGPIAPHWEDYGAAFADEYAHPGYYAVSLPDHDLHVELTATARVGVHRLWFPARDGDANVLIDVGRNVSWVQGRGWVRVVSPREVEGRVETGVFCGQGNHPVVYFVARFDRDAAETGTWQARSVRPTGDASGMAGAFLRFRTRVGEPLEVAVGISYVSTDGARENLGAEHGGRAFEAVHDAAARAWQAELARIRVEGRAADRRRFYTALYHALLHPNLLSDVSGAYPRAGVVGQSAEPRYTVFSLWDTYRTLHPLLTLVYPERQLAMLRSIADFAEARGRPPQWELLGEEVNMMVGDPAAIVVADSYAKGLTDFPAATLYARLRDAANDPAHRPGLADYLALGYVPMEEAARVWGPVSTTLEYAVADGALARLAEALGHSADASGFRARARGYATLFDPATGLLVPRNADGSAYAPFDPDAREGSAFQPGAGGPGYVEGTAWQYAFFVPHDTPGLIALHGEADFVARLQQVFDSGRFEMWNEPDLAYPYLFNYVAGESWRTQRAVRGAMDEHFGEGPAGLPGNDDAGTLSAWFIWSAIGLYPDAPGRPRYALGSPLFDRIEIALHPDFHAGERFVIDAAGNGPDAVYVGSATLDGQPLAGPFVDHAAIVAGGTLSLQMQTTP